MTLRDLNPGGKTATPSAHQEGSKLLRYFPLMKEIRRLKNQINIQAFPQSVELLYQPPYS